MGAHIIHRDGTAEEVSDREFFTRLFGHAPKTKAEREAEWRTDCERYADMIERGNEASVSPPFLHDARKIVAERAQLTAKAERADLTPKKLPNGRWSVAA